MKTFQGYRLITPDDLHWRPSNLMKIPNADFLECTGSENLGARLWRLPPRSANTLHKHRSFKHLSHSMAFVFHALRLSIAPVPVRAFWPVAFWH